MQEPTLTKAQCGSIHGDVIKWKHFLRYWPFTPGIHRSPVTSPHKGQWRGALMFSLICVWINGWVNNRESGDLRRYCVHYNVTVMNTPQWFVVWMCCQYQSWQMFFKITLPNKIFVSQGPMAQHAIWGSNDPLHCCIYIWVTLFREKS